MRPNTVASTTPTVALVHMTIGWSNGIADQLSLPNMSERLFGGPLRLYAPGGNRLEGIFDHRSIGALTGSSGGSQQLRNGRPIEDTVLPVRLGNPGCEPLPGLRPHREAHVGESGPAELRGNAGVRPGFIRL